MPGTKGGPSDGAPRARVALVCAGGGVAGGAFEVGCLTALDELLDRPVLDLDLYMGISAGAVVTSMLANGISPAEMYAEHLEGAGGLAAGEPLYRLAVGDVTRRLLSLPGLVGRAIRAGRRAEAAEVLLNWLGALPAGLFENSGMQRFLAGLFAAPGRTDSFRELTRRLLVLAVDLDAGELVCFGERGRDDMSISEAVQASTAIPGLFRPVRIGGRDYVDGAVKKTAHVARAIAEGADLVLCVNPVVPRRSLQAAGAEARLLGEVFDQTLRIVLHGRIQDRLPEYAERHPDVDVVLLEPRPGDRHWAAKGLLSWDGAAHAARAGYRATLSAFRASRSAYTAIFARHGIRVRDPRRVPAEPAVRRRQSPTGESLSSTLRALDASLTADAATATS